MFRPNIRGVDRRGLRFGWRGWRDADSDLFIRHRWPWRRSWTASLSDNDDLRPMLSRSGIVFLARSQSVEKAGDLWSIGNRRRHKALAIVILLIAGITTLFVGLPQTQSRTQAEPSTDLPGAVTVSCEKLLAEPGKLIETWLAGKTDSRLEIAELQRQQVGGVQSRIIQINCESLSKVLQMTLLLREKDWRLKKFTRLKS